MWSKLVMRRVAVRTAGEAPAPTVRARALPVPVGLAPAVDFRLQPAVRELSVRLPEPETRSSADQIFLNIETQARPDPGMDEPNTHSNALTTELPRVTVMGADIEGVSAPGINSDLDAVQALPVHARRVPFHRLSYRQIGRCLMILAQTNGYAPERVDLIGVYEGIPINRVTKLHFETETESLWFTPGPKPPEGVKWTRAVVGRSSDGSLIRAFEPQGREG